MGGAPRPRSTSTCSPRSPAPRPASWDRVRQHHAAAAGRHRAEVEHLLRVSSPPRHGRDSQEEVLAGGVRRHRRGARVRASVAPQGARRRGQARCEPSVVDRLDGPRSCGLEVTGRPRHDFIEPLLDAGGLQEGCALYELRGGAGDGGRLQAPSATPPRTGGARGLGPPLADGPAVRGRRRLLGLIWADDPVDRLLPPRSGCSRCARSPTRPAAAWRPRAARRRAPSRRARPDDGAAQPPQPPRPLDAGSRAGARCRCSSATSTPSSASTTRSATRRATRCSATSPRVCAGARVRVVPRGWAARSSPWCCRGGGGRGDGRRGLRRAAAERFTDRGGESRSGWRRHERAGLASSGADARRHPRPLRRQESRPRPLRHRARRDARAARRVRDATARPASSSRR